MSRHLRWPSLLIYRAAVSRRFAILPNRYPSGLIGIAVQVGHRVFSLRWARP